MWHIQPSVRILPLISHIALADYLTSLGLSFLIVEWPHKASCRNLVRVFNDVFQGSYPLPDNRQQGELLRCCCGSVWLSGLLTLRPLLSLCSAQHLITAVADHLFGLKTTSW